MKKSHQPGPVGCRGFDDLARKQGRVFAGGDDAAGQADVIALFDTIYEAAAELKMQIESEPHVLSQVKRLISELQVEKEARSHSGRPAGLIMHVR